MGPSNAGLYEPACYNFISKCRCSPATFQSVLLMKTTHSKTVADDAVGITFEQMYRDPCAMNCVQRAIRRSTRASSARRMFDDLVSAAWLRIFEAWDKFQAPVGVSEKQARLGWMWRIACNQTADTLEFMAITEACGGMDVFDWVARGSDTAAATCLDKLIDVRSALAGLDKPLVAYTGRRRLMDEALTWLLEELLTPQPLQTPVVRTKEQQDLWVRATNRIAAHREKVDHVLGPKSGMRTYAFLR